MFLCEERTPLITSPPRKYSPAYTQILKASGSSANLGTPLDQIGSRSFKSALTGRSNSKVAPRSGLGVARR